MKLKNRDDGQIYTVITEDDCHGGFMIYAQHKKAEKSFCMHYQKLREFCDDWEDVNN